MSQLVLVSGPLVAAPETRDIDGRPVTTFVLRVSTGTDASTLWHGTAYLGSVRRVLERLEAGAPVAVAGAFHIDVFKEPKVKLRYLITAQQVLILRPAGKSLDGDGGGP